MARKFGLIGTGISQSGSPALFKAAFGGKYSYDLLDGKNFPELLERFKAEYTAVNVTSPFKVQAFEAAQEFSEAAQLCGAANMLIKLPDGKILADNSDFEGVTLSIMSACAVADIDVDDEEVFDDYISERTVLIAGCGGAGMAAAAAAVTMGYGKTILINRDREKAEAVKKHLADFYSDVADDEIEVRPISEFTASFKEADDIIYTIPTAVFKPEELADCEGKMILEANYKTPCLEFLKEKCTYISGLNWLFNQAVVAYEAFTGEEPDEEEMKKVL